MREHGEGRGALRALRESVTIAKQFESLLARTDRTCDHDVEEAWNWVTRNRGDIYRALRLHEAYSELDWCGSENAYAEGWNDCLSVMHEAVK